MKLLIVISFIILFLVGCASTGQTAYTLWNNIDIGMSQYRMVRTGTPGFKIDSRWKLVSESSHMQIWQWSPHFYNPYEPFYAITVTIEKGVVTSKVKSF